ncbi:MAG: S1C family serine protease [Verrucomicrobiota bacterium]|jgi:serine protease Do
MPSSPFSWLTAAAALMAAASMGYAWRGWHQQKATRTASGTAPAPEIRLGETPLAAALNDELAAVVAQVLPGVVSIHVERRVAATEPLLRPGKLPQETSAESREPGVGSGAIVTREGHIITNWHVIEGALDTLTVTLHGEESPRKATLVDKDDQLDFAVLRVEPRSPGERFSPLSLADSDKVRAGHMVLALGSPFNLSETVTHGIISKRDRRVSDTYTTYLQTTCTINPGNSGGPLVSLRGDIIGMVTRKLMGPDDDASAEGYGLAIPSNDIADALDRFLNRSRPRTYLGLTVDDWPENYYQTGSEPEAVIVRGVARSSPAESAGLQKDDIIEAVDGRRVTSTGEYRRALRSYPVGSTITLTIRRGREAVTCPLKVADFDRALPPESPGGSGTVLGLALRPLRRYERNLLGLEESIGLCVESIAEDSPLRGLLKQGDALLHVSDSARRGVVPLSGANAFRDFMAEHGASGGFLIVGRPRERDAWIPFLPLSPTATPEDGKSSP